jgi:hypothetical protein
MQSLKGNTSMTSAIAFTCAAAAFAAVSGYYIAFAFFKSKRIIEAISKEPVLSRSAAIATCAGAFLAGSIVSAISAWIAPAAHDLAIGTALLVGVPAGLFGMYRGIKVRTKA